MDKKPDYTVNITDMWDRYYLLSGTMEDLGVNEEVLGNFLALIREDNLKELGKEKEKEEEEGIRRGI